MALHLPRSEFGLWQSGTSLETPNEGHRQTAPEEERLNIGQNLILLSIGAGVHHEPGLNVMAQHDRTHKPGAHF